MNNRHLIISTVAVGLAAALGSSAAQAADAYLRAESFTKALPDGASVTMWGYRSCAAPLSAGGPFEACGPASSPGPEISVPFGDTSLTIYLENGLAADATSIMIAGQTKSMTPQEFTDGLGRTRIRAFDVEAAAAGGQQTYTWNNLRPGTYLYQSASHVQLQVQMGLYGAMVRDAAAGEAYAGVPYAQSKVIVFSEIDPALHDPEPKAANLTVDGYRPSYFLLNGEPFVAGADPLATVAPADRLLLRLVNAGLQNRAPQLLGGYYEIIAEDGFRAPAPRLQYNTLLPAGKALDVLFTGSAGSYSLYDRRLGLVNGLSTNGGQQGQIVVSAP